MARMPTKPELEKAVREAVSVANVEEMSLKMIRKGLEERFEVDLTNKKSFLKETVTSILLEGQEEHEEEGQDEADEDDEEQGEEQEEEQEEEAEKPASKTKAAKKEGKTKPKPNDHQLSPALFEFMGSKETLMTRGDVTKAVWAYIREQSLQDPKDRRKIRNDDKMIRVFKCKTMSMMHIAKKLSPHLKKYSDLVGSEAETAGSRDEGGDDDDQRGAKKRKAGGSSTTPKAKKAQARGGSSSKARPKPAATGAAKKGAKSKTPTGGRR